MSEFNPESFLQTETTEATETKYTPVDAGDYQALIDDIKIRGTKTGSQILDVFYDIVDQEIKDKLGQDKVLVRQSIFLDLENGALAIGLNKNVKLGKVREAVGQNTSGKPWSPLMLKGAGPVLIKVSQRPDDDDPEIVYNDVTRVVAA